MALKFALIAFISASNKFKVFTKELTCIIQYIIDFSIQWFSSVQPDHGSASLKKAS